MRERKGRYDTNLACFSPPKHLLVRDAGQKRSLAFSIELFNIALYNNVCVNKQITLYQDGVTETLVLNEK